MAGERCKNLLPFDDPAPLYRPCFRAESDTACRCRTALREGLRIDRAVLDDTLVVDRTSPLVLGADLCIHVEIVGERTRPQRRADMHVPRERSRAAIAADFGCRQCVSL